jgi:L-iditol 2-dehydrogenase
MQVIVQTGENEVRIAEREQPEVKPGQALLRVHSAGLCGSDAHAYRMSDGYEWVPMDRIMGHEYAAEVVEVGPEVAEFEPGDAVVEMPVAPCGNCRQCRLGQYNVCQDFSIRGLHRDGAYAEYISVDTSQLVRVPDDVPLETAAIAEPTSIASRTVLERSEISAGDSVLVEGPGPIGILSAAVADAIGADVLVSGIDQDAPHRLPLVSTIGIETIDVSEDDLNERAEAFTDGDGFDAVVDATGHPSGLETAVDHVRKGGEAIVVGIPREPSEVLMTDVVRGEVDLKTSYGSLIRDFERALAMLGDGAIDTDRITSEWAVEDAADAFESFLAGDSTKPVFRFEG